MSDYKFLYEPRCDEMIEKHIYAIEFDNTIVYKGTMKPLPYSIAVLRRLSLDPHAILILWTSREGKELEEAVNFYEMKGIIFDRVNENYYENETCRKIKADVYIDGNGIKGLKGVENLWKDWWEWMNRKK